MRKSATAALIAAALMATSAFVLATPMQGWRTNGTGVHADVKVALTEWSKDKNVAWKADIGKWSNATPLVIDGKVFVQDEDQRLLAFDAATGAKLWQATVQYDDAKVDERLPRTHDQNGYSTPTPVSDGKNVYVVMGNGVAAAFSLDGKRLWTRLVEKPTAGWGLSSSPLIADGKLIVQVIGLHALDVETGKTLWTTPAGARHGSPVGTSIGGVDVVLTPAGQVVRASDGKVLTKGLLDLEYNAPVVVGNRVYYVNERPRNGNCVAYDLPAKIEGDSLELKPAWSANVRGDRYYASPLVVGDRLYVINRSGRLTILDATNGKSLGEGEFGGNGQHYSSPTEAGGLIYLNGESGTTLVLKPEGDSLKPVATNRLPGFKSCPVFVGNRIFIRAGNALYALEQK